MKTRRLFAVLACALVASVTITLVLRKIRDTGPIAGYTTPVSHSVPAIVRSLRPNFPYSVIPGGAYSPAELRFANSKDQVIREHYADFNLKETRLVELAEDRYQYVSYRLNNRIFWTGKKLRIPKGEHLLTDGQNYARARCGNRLSDKPNNTVSPLEPAAGLLALPPPRFDTLPQLELADAPPQGELAQQFRSLPDDAPRLAPVLPGGETVLPVAWPSAAIAPVITPAGPGPARPLAPIPPSSPLTPPLPPAEIPPVLPLQNTPPVSTVPEPSSIYLFVVTFVLSLWALTRMMRDDEQTDISGK